MATEKIGDDMVEHQEHQDHVGDVDVIQTVHKDGAVDYVDTHAIGGDLSKMPVGYFYSIQFIGTVTVSLHSTYDIADLLTANRQSAVQVSARIWDGFCPPTHCPSHLLLQKAKSNHMQS